MKHVNPQSLIVNVADLAAASDWQDRARRMRDGARHKLRIHDRLGHRWAMQDAIRAWREAAFYYRRARNG